MSIRLIEVKQDNHHRENEREFLFKISTTEHVLHWEELLLDEDKIKKYLKQNPFPKDKYYSKKEFFNDISCEGYVCVLVEKVETAEYIAELFYELI